MVTFTGLVGPTGDVGPTAPLPDQPRDWTAAYPLWVSDAAPAGWQRHMAAPDVMIDVFGFSPASSDQIRSAARELACSGDLMVLDTIATGSAVVVVREPHRVTVLTDLAGVWPVFYTTVGGSLIYGSTASAVAAQVGNEVNVQWLAARLLAGGIPAAWSEASPYRQVAAVPPGGVLLIGGNGRAAVVRRELPLGKIGFAEGAQRLVEALASAVDDRMGVYRQVSTDLSGGLDSSTVAALAAATQPDVTVPAITLGCTDSFTAWTKLDTDDPRHARMVAAAVPGIRHIELALPAEAEPYSSLTEMPHTDEPFEDSSIFARLRWWMTSVAELGGRAHLTGDGGDAVLTAPPAYLADLVQRCELRELWSHAAGWARLRQRPVHRLVGAARRLARITEEGADRALRKGRGARWCRSGPSAMLGRPDRLGSGATAPAVVHAARPRPGCHRASAGIPRTL